MPQLVKIQSELFPRLYAAFLHDDDPLSDEQDWRNILDYQWEKDEDYTGYALLEDDQVIGMMAMAFSTRLLNNTTHKFCNLHTWWVHEEHRGRSLVMLRPLLNLGDYTVTDFTPSDRVRGLSKRIGFVDLNLQLKILLPLWFRQRSQSRTANFLFEDEMILPVLADHERRILLDHQPYRVGSLLIQDGHDHCYLLYTHVVRYRFNYCHIHYIGNKALFAEHEHAVRNQLLKRHRVRAVVLDCRLTEGMKFKNSFNFWAPAHAVYKPAGGVTADQVDNLYSDVVMLRLAVLPHVSHELKALARRWLRPNDR